ncbi:MAG: hypothetical protein GX163_02455, partial [Bacteroidetes bacterium]|nr:hypothetical protein [Bacteroidota bacterium]
MAIQKKTIAQILGSVVEKEAFEKSFAAHVPYIGIIDNIFYLDNERAGFMFEFKPVDNFRMDDYEFHSLKKNLDGFLNQVDQDLVMQVKVVKNGYFDDLIQSHVSQNKSKKKLVDEIFSKRIEKITTSINKYEIFKYSYIISFSKKINILNASSMEAFFKAPETITSDWEKQFKQVHQSMTELVEKIGTGLKAIGLNIKTPSHQETIDHIATSINLIPTKIDCTPDEVVYPEDLINSCISKNHSYIFLNDKYVKIISIKKSCPPKDIITFS